MVWQHSTTHKKRRKCQRENNNTVNDSDWMIRHVWNVRCKSRKSSSTRSFISWSFSFLLSFSFVFDLRLFLCDENEHDSNWNCVFNSIKCKTKWAKIIIKKTFLQFICFSFRRRLFVDARCSRCTHFKSIACRHTFSHPHTSWRIVEEANRTETTRSTEWRWTNWRACRSSIIIPIVTNMT